MPLFFIISGYLYSRPKNVATYISKKFKSLLIPYFLVGTVYCFLSLLLFGKERAIKSLIGVFFQSVSNIPIESGLWFLPALFWVTIFYALVDLYVTKNSLRIGIIVLLTIVGTVWTSYFPNLPFALTPALSVFGFFSVGHWLNIYGEQFVEGKVSENKIVVLMGMLFLVFASLLIEMNGIVNVRAGKYSIIPLSYLSASLFSVSLFFIVKKVIKAKLLPIERYLCFVGRTSILLHHSMQIKVT